jgi:hypothetical protein
MGRNRMETICRMATDAKNGTIFIQFEFDL